jgi:hypothetical protein
MCRNNPPSDVKKTGVIPDSWGAGIWRWFHQPLNFTEVGRASVLFFYLPMLLVLLLRKNAPYHALADSP